MIDNLEEARIIKRQAVVKAKLYIYLISALPFLKKYKCVTLYRVVKLHHGEYTIE